MEDDEEEFNISEDNLSDEVSMEEEDEEDDVEVMEEEAIDELEEAALESSPVCFFRLDLCVVSLPTDELAAQADPKRSIDRYKASRLLRFIFSEMLIPRDAV